MEILENHSTLFRQKFIQINVVTKERVDLTKYFCDIKFFVVLPQHCVFRNFQATHSVEIISHAFLAKIS